MDSVLESVSDEIWNQDKYLAEILIMNNDSSDRLSEWEISYRLKYPRTKLTILDNPENPGYGGNQKLGYQYAIENHFDVVVLLRDVQYTPELIWRLAEPILTHQVDAVFGSRMTRHHEGLRAKVSVDTWFGNWDPLNGVQNFILGTQFTETQSRCRAYSVQALTYLPFIFNSDRADFDMDITIQFLESGNRIGEIAVSTSYCRKVSALNEVGYALRSVYTLLISRMMRWGIFYDPKFDYETSNQFYTAKFGFPSSHQFALDRVPAGATVLELGCGPGFMSIELSKKDVKVIAVDQYIQPDVSMHSLKAVEVDIDNYDFDMDLTDVDYVFVLDVIEHLKAPESFLRKLRNSYSGSTPEVIVTTGNIGFFTIRLGLLLGLFNYGKRGILDLDHKRLFTFSSLRRTLEVNGYVILEERGIPAPFPLAFGDGWFSRVLLWINGLLIKLSKTLFSYQIALVVKPKPTLNHILQDAREAAARKGHRVRSPVHDKTLETCEG